MMIGTGLYIAPIKYFSYEIGINYDEDIFYYELGIGFEHLENTGIRPYEKCIATPFGGKPKTFVEKLKENRFKIVSVDDSFFEFFHPSQKEGVVLPEILTDKFSDTKYIVLNFTFFRVASRKNNIIS